MTVAGSKPRKQRRRPAAIGSRAAHERREDRVHLRLVVDPRSHQKRLDLLVPVFSQNWQNRMVAATANTAFFWLTRETSLTSVTALARKAMASTSTLVDGLLAQAPAGRIACQPGCDHCCHQSVGVTPPEALAIFAHLVETRSPEQLEALHQKVSAAAKRTRGLTSRERLSPDLPCPLLEDRQCSIYEVRPLSCRGMNSLDASVCEQRLRPSAAPAASTGEAPPGFLFAEPIRAFHAISAGLQLALSERFGLDMRPLDLTFALSLLLDEKLGPKADRSNSLAVPAALRRSHPESGQSEAPPGGLTPPPLKRPLAVLWLSGKPAFEDARGGDASDDARRAELAGRVPHP